LPLLESAAGSNDASTALPLLEVTAGSNDARADLTLLESAAGDNAASADLPLLESDGIIFYPMPLPVLECAAGDNAARADLPLLEISAGDNAARADVPLLESDGLAHSVYPFTGAAGWPLLEISAGDNAAHADAPLLESVGLAHSVYPFTGAADWPKLASAGLIPQAYPLNGAASLPLLQIVSVSIGEADIPLLEVSASCLVGGELSARDSLPALACAGSMNYGGYAVASTGLPRALRLNATAFSAERGDGNARLRVPELSAVCETQYARPALPLPEIIGAFAGNASASATLPKAVCAGVLIPGRAMRGNARLPTITLSSYAGLHSSHVLPRLAGSGQILPGEWADCSPDTLRIPLVALQAEGISPVIIHGNMTLPGPQLSASSQAGTHARLASSWPRLRLVAAAGFQGTVATARHTLPRLSLGAAGYSAYIGSAAGMPMPRFVLKATAWQRKTGT